MTAWASCLRNAVSTEPKASVAPGLIRFGAAEESGLGPAGAELAALDGDKRYQHGAKRREPPGLGAGRPRRGEREGGRESGKLSRHQGLVVAAEAAHGEEKRRRCRQRADETELVPDLERQGLRCRHRQLPREAG